jgi:hypothetical protein
VIERVEQVIENVDEEAVMRSMRTPLLAIALGMYLLGLLLLRLPDHSIGATVVRPERKKTRWGDRKSLAPPSRQSKPPEERAA